MNIEKLDSDLSDVKTIDGDKAVFSGPCEVPAGKMIYVKRKYAGIIQERLKLSGATEIKVNGTHLDSMVNIWFELSK